MAQIKYEMVGGPHGDCTSTYKVTTDAETINELVYALIKEGSFVTITLHEAGDSILGGLCLAYARGGKVERRASCFNEVLDLKPTKIMMNGGYGNNTFDVWVEDQLPAQDREEFELVYWGKNFKV